MRKLILTLALALSAGLAVAQDEKASAQAPPKDTAAQAPAAVKESKDFTALVLSTDPVAKTITIKKDSDPMLAGSEPERTLAVDAKALASLKTVNVGEKVKLVVRADASGKETVTTIEKPAATEKNPPPDKN